MPAGKLDLLPCSQTCSFLLLLTKSDGRLQAPLEVPFDMLSHLVIFFVPSSIACSISQRLSLPRSQRAGCRPPWERPTPAGPAERPHTKLLPGFIHALWYFKISHHFYLVFAFFFHRVLQLPTSWQTGSRSTCVLFPSLALACQHVCLFFAFPVFFPIISP